MRTLTLLFRLLGRAITVAAIGVAALTVGGLAVVSMRGEQLMIVLSGSMQPEFDAGDAVLVAPAAEQDLRPGQVVSFHAPGQPEQLTTHRIVSLRPMKDGLYLQTQGDANPHPDPDFAAAGSVVGVVHGSAPHLGHWLAFYQAPHGRMLVLGLPLGLLCAAQARSTWREFRRRTTARRLSPTFAAAAAVVVVSMVAGTMMARATAARFTGADSVPTNVLATATTYCGAASGYATAVGADNPFIYHRFSETNPTTTAANTGTGGAGYAGTYTAALGYTLNRPGAISCETASRAVGLNGSTGQVVNNNTTAAAGPNVFSLEVWFKTTTGGGKLVGFGNNRTGTSTNRDRHIYLTNTGQVVFGVNPTAGMRTVTSPSSYLDNRWHHVVATLGATAPTNGMRLYVDGQLVASRTDTTTAQTYNGFVRIGYDDLTGWTSAPTNHWYTGDLDEVAVYTTTLTAARVLAHYNARRN